MEISPRAYLNDPGAAGTVGANEVTNTPAGGIAATDVQAAINELDAEKVDIAGDTMTGGLVMSIPAAGYGANQGAVSFSGTQTTLPTSCLLGGAATVPVYSFTSGSPTATIAWRNTVHWAGTVGGQIQAYGGDLRVTQNSTAVSTGNFNPLGSAVNAGIRTLSGFGGDWQGEFVGAHFTYSHTAGAGTISGAMSGVQVGIPGYTAGGTVTGANYGVRVANQGNAGFATTYGAYVTAQTGSATANYGIAVGAATTQTLWVSENTNSTTAAGGIAFGSSRDTNLYRSAAGVVKTDGSLHATARASIGATLFTDRLLNVSGDPGTATTVIGAAVTPSAGTSTTYLTAGWFAGDVAASVAINTVKGLYVANGTIGGGGSVVNKIGMLIDPQTGGATTNVGIAVAASATQTVWVSSDANNTTAGAGIAFGSSRDTNLYRAAANVLRTDDEFRANGNSIAQVDNAAKVGIGALGPASEAAITFGSAGTDMLYLPTAGTVQARASGTDVFNWTSSRLGFNDARNILFGSTTGTKIGTATTQKFAFWNKTPIVQPTTGITAATFTENAGTAVNDASTFGGYTIGQIAAALINVGLLA